MTKRVNSRKDAEGLIDKACAAGISVEERDGLRAYVVDLHQANHRTTTALNWRLISTLRESAPDAMVLAACPPCGQFPEGRVMIWKTSILMDGLKRGNETPQHLRYPATLWKPLPVPNWEDYT